MREECSSDSNFPIASLIAGEPASIAEAPARRSLMRQSHALVPTDQIKPHSRNARTHSKKQIRQIAASISAFGFAAPILIDENNVLIAGHGRLQAAKLLGMSSIPAVIICGLS